MRLMIFPILCLVWATTGIAQPVPLPAGGWAAHDNWSVDYANDQCAALRPFRSGSNEIIFGIRPRPIIKTAEIVIVVHGEGDTIEGTDGTISFGTGNLDR